MKNTLQDLNNHLFEQLERLNDEDLTDDQLDRELRRAELERTFPSREGYVFPGTLLRRLGESFGKK